MTPGNNRIKQSAERFEGNDYIGRLACSDKWSARPCRSSGSASRYRRVLCNWRAGPIQSHRGIGPRRRLACSAGGSPPPSTLPSQTSSPWCVRDWVGARLCRRPAALEGVLVLGGPILSIPSAPFGEFAAHAEAHAVSSAIRGAPTTYARLSLRRIAIWFRAPAHR
jgi:hypothetical protein